MKDPPAQHPLAGKTNPAVLAEIKKENVQLVAYLMALDQSGGLENVPPQAIDDLLAAQRAGKLDREQVAETLNALQDMKPKTANALLKAIDAVPASQKQMAWVVLAREHYGLRSNDAAQRDGAIARAT